jgi:hypothetical protein
VVMRGVVEGGWGGGGEGAHIDKIRMRTVQRGDDVGCGSDGWWWVGRGMIESESRSQNVYNQEHSIFRSFGPVLQREKARKKYSSVCS